MVEIPHCAIIESESDYDDLFVLRAADSECFPYWNFCEVLESELSDYYVAVKVQHFSKVTLVSQRRKQKGKVKIRKKQNKAKQLKGQHSLDSSIKYVRQSSLESTTSDPGSSGARKRTYSSPASSSGPGSKDDMLSTTLNEFTIVCCTPQAQVIPFVEGGFCYFLLSSNRLDGKHIHNIYVRNLGGTNKLRWTTYPIQSNYLHLNIQEVSGGGSPLPWLGSCPPNILSV